MCDKKCKNLKKIVLFNWNVSKIHIFFDYKMYNGDNLVV